MGGLKTVEIAKLQLRATRLCRTQEKGHLQERYDIERAMLHPPHARTKGGTPIKPTQ